MEYYKSPTTYSIVSYPYPAAKAMNGKNIRPQLPTTTCGLKRQKKLRIPDLTDDVEEIRRLMKRSRHVENKEMEGCEDFKCDICRSQNHFYMNCPCLDEIPKGVVLGPRYDEVCIRCGTIGANCCSKGAYAHLKFCGVCRRSGHWHWEDTCHIRCRHPWTAELQSIRNSIEEGPSSDLSLENSLQNKLSVNDWEEDDDGSKGESSNWSKSKSCKEVDEPGVHLHSWSDDVNSESRYNHIALSA